MKCSISTYYSTWGHFRSHSKIYIRDIEGRRRGRPRVPRFFTGDTLPFEVFVKGFLTLSGSEVHLKSTSTKSRSPHLFHGGLSAADLLEEDQSVSTLAVYDHLVYRSELMELHVQVLFRHTIWKRNLKYCFIHHVPLRDISHKFFDKNLIVRGHSKLIGSNVPVSFNVFSKRVHFVVIIFLFVAIEVYMFIMRRGSP